MPDIAEHPCRATRAHAFGFEAITADLQTHCAREFARLVMGWSLIFSDVETAHSWRECVTANGLEFIKYGFWLKERGMPQISGDRPASWVEQITIAHAMEDSRPIAKFWNAGGQGNVWRTTDEAWTSTCPVVVNDANCRTQRIHTAQKPLGLMLDLVRDFTAPESLIFDPLSGSGTTGLAALRLGRRYLGIEQKADWADLQRERLAAEEAQSTLQDRQAGQMPLLGYR